MLLIDKFRQRRIVKLMDGHERAPHYMSFDEATTFLLLYQSEESESNDIIKEIVRLLQQEGKRVWMVGYVDKKLAQTASLETTLMLDRSQVTCLGAPNRDRVGHLLDQHFDVVIDLTLQPVIALQYILFWADASLKTGASAGYSKHLDLMIALPNPSDVLDMEEGDSQKIDQLYLYNQIVFYLRALKSRNKEHFN